MSTFRKRPVTATRKRVARQPAREIIVVAPPAPKKAAATRKNGNGNGTTTKKKEHIAEGLFSLGGGLLGSAIGGAPGAVIGKGIGSVLSKITGFGDYQIEHNSIMGKGILSPPEVVNSLNHGGVIIRHREYIADIDAQSADFTIQSFSINPGLSSTFPWLSAVATAYEEYEFRGLVFEFKSLSSDSVLSSATSSALGFVAMATQYNSAAANFTNKKALENYEYANSDKPSCSFLHPVECKRRLNAETHLYLRSAAVPAGQDQKTYDLGDFNIAVGGCQSNTGVLGELWCTYEVELFHPRYEVGSGTARLDLLSASSATAFSNAAPLGTTTVPNPLHGITHPIGATVGGSGTTLNFPSLVTDGNFQVFVGWTGSVAAAFTVPAVTFTNNCELIIQPYVNNSANFFVAPSALAVTTVCDVAFFVKITGPNAQITFGGLGSLPTGNRSIDIVINEVDDSFRSLG